MKGDEIMVINGAIVSDLDMMFIESVLQEELTLCMMLRSARTGTSNSWSNKNNIFFIPKIIFFLLQIHQSFRHWQVVEMLI